MGLDQALRTKTKATVFTSSMADVVLLLIVFFVLTWTATPDTTVLTLPKTMVRTEVPRDAAIISIAALEDNGVIRVSTGKQRSLAISDDEELVTFAANVVAADNRQAFVVKADEGTPYERIDMVLEALESVQAQRVFLLSEQKTVE